MSAAAPEPFAKRARRLAPKIDPVSDPASESHIWNIPNCLTMFRLVLVIPFAILLFAGHNSDAARIWAAIIFIIASITDFFDGHLARKMNLVTTFGKLADPIADKALTGVALIGLSFLHELSWWITIVILFREVAVTLLRFWVIKFGVISASRGGKAKTVAQLIAIILYLMPLTGIGVTISEIVMGVAVVLTVVTGFDYLIRALNLRRHSSSRQGSAVPVG